MNKQQLQAILSSPYDQDNWKKVLIEVFGVKNIPQQAPSVPLSENDLAVNAFEIADFTTTDDRIVGIFEVNLQPKVKIEANKVGIKRILESIYKYDVDAALIVFVANDRKQWRFSFVSDIKVFNEQTQEIERKTTEEQKSRKRFTYLLGINESCRTAAEQFLFLQDKPFTLNDLYEAFNVDKLNKAFFKSYKERYETLWQHIKSKHEYYNLLIDNEQTDINKAEKPIRDFAKKLLGRIVFLYFLQKKGWMGVPADRSDWRGGDPNFIKNFFQNTADKSKFYSKNLIELFYNTLNQVRENDLFHLTGTKIPYLNGGLFDNDQPETNHFDFPESYFTELFEFFDQYNFTIDENDPDDANVGIDPEMLGHIFENLLEENKDKGTFYTPKAIVQYMCQESLIQYLATATNADLTTFEELSNLIRHNERGNLKGFITRNARKIEELLDNIKICDPAIGSGAFPMGMLQSIFKAKMTLDLTLDPAETKRHIIQNSIYGVDLERGAVDIARLRFWLALVVDEDSPSPLPNLDYKIMQGNSLLESFEGIDLSKIHQEQVQVFEPQRDLFGNLTAPQMTIFQSQNSEDLQKLINKYFDIENIETKKDLRKKINDAVHEHIEFNIETRENQIFRRIAEAGKPENLNPKARKNYEKLIEEQTQLTQSRHNLHALQDRTEKPYFLWHLFFKDVFEQGGFDIVIGNPPYVRQEALGAIKTILEKAYPKTYKGTADLLVYFVELGYNLLRTNGVFAYIVSNKWIRAGYGEGMRKLLTQNRLLELIDFGDLPVFEGATAYPCVVRFQKASPMEAFSVTIATELPQKVGLLNHVQQNNFSLKLTELDPEGWQLNNPVQQSLLTKLNKNAQSLEDYINGEAYYGIKTGASDEFSLDEIQRTALILEDAKSAEIIKPVLLGRDIARYQITKTQRYMIFTRRGIDIEQYPAILKHLLPFKDRLTPKPKDWKGEWQGRKEGSYKWYELQDAVDYYQLFDKPKIMYQKFQVKPCFIYDEEGLYCNDSMWIIPTDNKYLLGVLNSKVGWYAITQYCTKIQNGYQLIYDYLRKVPIAVPTETQKKQIETLVNQILSNKKEGKDTIALEAEIDHLVYALYELTEAEIKIVEGER